MMHIHFKFNDDFLGVHYIYFRAYIYVTYILLTEQITNFLTDDKGKMFRKQQLDKTLVLGKN